MLNHNTENLRLTQMDRRKSFTEDSNINGNFENKLIPAIILMLNKLKEIKLLKSPDFPNTVLKWVV